MTDLNSIGCCAILTQLLGTWGSFAQIRLNRRRTSTEGLSFFYWESRVWSKLPWFAFGLSLKTVDWSIILSIALALIPPFLVLHQFQKYSRSRSPQERAALQMRLCGQYGLLVFTLVLAILAREKLATLGVLLSVAPVFCTAISVAGGGLAQFRLNNLCGSTAAVAGERYILLVICNLLWLHYGITKGLLMGWSEAWTVSTCSAIGVAVYAILVIQTAIFKTWTVRPLYRSPILQVRRLFWNIFGKTLRDDIA